jgi:hypothetical protein
MDARPWQTQELSQEDMTITAETVVSGLVEGELAVLSDQRVVTHIRSLLVTPFSQMRAWDYGTPDEAYPCWMVLAHRPSNTGISYCESGFGPGSPWGLLALEGTDHMSMGMDSSWFTHFLDGYFSSSASTELPIWRVFQHQGEDFPGTPITGEDTWDSTWAEIMRLRSVRPKFRFDCWQSVYVRRDA